MGVDGGEEESETGEGEEQCSLPLLLPLQLHILWHSLDMMLRGGGACLNEVCSLWRLGAKGLVGSEVRMKLQSKL